MPYPSPPSGSGGYRKTEIVRFSRRDGTGRTQVPFQEAAGPTPQADMEEGSAHDKAQLGCGCYWPDAAVVGACDACMQAHEPAEVCEKHYVVCACGAPCCWRHSHPIDDATERQCTHCHLRAQNKAALTAISTTARTALGRLLFKS